jgi:16S rRNA (cytidine1402-2'-O)-methyltransferase
LIFYESPNRLAALLADVDAVLGTRQLCVAREVTKLYEEFVRGTAQEALAYFGDKKVRGEITLVLAGAEPDSAEWDEVRVKAQLSAEIAQGTSRKDAVARIAALSGWRKRRVYDLSLEENRPDS